MAPHCPSSFAGRVGHCLVTEALAQMDAALHNTGCTKAAQAWIGLLMALLTMLLVVLLIVAGAAWWALLP